MNNCVGVKDIDWVYRNLICELTHWDICLSGIVMYECERVYCKFYHGEGGCAIYNLYQIDWTEECEEYFKDYQEAFKHWCYKDGKRVCDYSGWDLEWFIDKWKDKFPIAWQFKDKK